MEIKLRNLIFKFEISQADAIIGIGSKINKNNFVGFFDLDRTTPVLAEEIIKKLQKKHKLGSFLLFKSSKNNHHAVCLDSKKLISWVMIEYLINPAHAGLSLFKGEHVLRFSSKFKSMIKFIKIVESEHSNVISESHQKFFQRRFEINFSNFQYKNMISGDVNYHFYRQKKRLF